MKTGTRKINFLLEPCKRAYLRREATREANNRIIALNSYEGGNRRNWNIQSRQYLEEVIEDLRYLMAFNPESASRYKSQLAEAELDLQELERWA